MSASRKTDSTRQLLIDEWAEKIIQTLKETHQQHYPDQKDSANQPTNQPDPEFSEQEKIWLKTYLKKHFPPVSTVENFKEFDDYLDEKSTPAQFRIPAANHILPPDVVYCKKESIDILVNDVRNQRSSAILPPLPLPPTRSRIGGLLLIGLAILGYIAMAVTFPITSLVVGLVIALVGGFVIGEGECKYQDALGGAEPGSPAQPPASFASGSNINAALSEQKRGLQCKNPQKCRI